MRIEDEEQVLFRLAHLENKVKRLELAPAAMPVLYMDLSVENPVTRNFYCYKSNAVARVSANAPSGKLEAELNGKTYNMTAPTYFCVPLKKGNNKLTVTSFGSYGDLVIEILETRD